MSRKPKSGSSVRGSLITSASWVAAVDDATRDYQLRHRLGQGSEPPRSDIPTDKIRVKLASGGPYPIGTPLEVGSALFMETTRSKNWHQADLRSGFRTIGVLLEPAKTTKLAWLQLDGVCPALVNVTDRDHTHAYADVGASQLTSNFGGPIELVTPPSAVGSQPLLVRLGAPLLFRKAKATSTIAAGSSGSASFWIDGSNKGDETIWYNWMESGIASISSGTEVLVEWFDDERKWVVVQLECQA